MMSFCEKFGPFLLIWVAMTVVDFSQNSDISEAVEGPD
jgi:hypothetical protein